MQTYVALLRGIMPTNPNMRSGKLKGFFESLGFENARTVIASGNVVFESKSKDAGALEKKIEQALPRHLDFKSTTMVRSREELQKLLKKDPFKGIKDEKPNYLVVTFFKDRRPALCTAVDLSQGTTPGFMRDMEKKHGKAMTTRTWKTVRRILEKMDAE